MSKFDALVLNAVRHLYEHLLQWLPLLCGNGVTVLSSSTSYRKFVKSPIQFSDELAVEVFEEHIRIRSLRSVWATHGVSFWYKRS